MKNNGNVPLPHSVLVRKLLITGLCVFFLSLLTSNLAERLPYRIAFFGDFLGLQLAHNSGIAFSIDILPSPLLTTAVIITLGVLIVVSLRARPSSFERLAFCLIIAGAAANLLDRLPDGFVTDFIQIGTFPIFNLADSAITIGAAMLFWDSIAARKAALPQK